MSVGQIAFLVWFWRMNNLQLLTDEVNQFWQNLLSKLVGFPLDGGGNWGSSVSTSITSDTASVSTSNSMTDSVVVSSVKKVWETEEKGDEEEEGESYEDETGGDIVSPAPSTTITTSLPSGGPVAGRIRNFGIVLLGSCSGHSNKGKSNNTDNDLHFE